MKLRALRPLSGDYGFVREGQTFVTDEATAQSLISRGLAERYREPQYDPVARAVYEAKVVTAPELKLAEPSPAAPPEVVTRRADAMSPAPPMVRRRR